MSDLQKVRVEAAARAAALVDDYDGCFERLDGTDPEEPLSTDSEDAEWWRKRARAALAAADAVVTEEQIAETILKALVFTNENSKPWADGLARDIAAMFRGGAK